MTSTKSDHALYDQLIEIMNDCLGPAGVRFLDRQIETHLKMRPSDISLADLDQFREWVKVSLELLTDDKKLVDNCLTSIDELKTA